MIDLFNHRIDVKGTKPLDISKNPSNAFRSTQVKPKVKVIEEVKEVQTDANDAPLIDLTAIVVEKISEPAKLMEEVLDQEVFMTTGSIDVKDVKKPARKPRTRKAEVK